MLKVKLCFLLLGAALSGIASAQKMSPQDIANHEASEAINRTSLSRLSIEESLLNDYEIKLSKKVVEVALAKAEKEWGGPSIWNEKAEMSAETAMSQKKLSCPELLSDLVQRQKFTVPQANHAAKKLNVCQ